jgi:hypothetical protein
MSVWSKIRAAYQRKPDKESRLHSAFMFAAVVCVITIYIVSVALLFELTPVSQATASVTEYRYKHTKSNGPGLEFTYQYQVEGAAHSGTFWESDSVANTQRTQVQIQYLVWLPSVSRTPPKKDFFEQNIFGVLFMGITGGYVVWYLGRKKKPVAGQ